MPIMFECIPAYVTDEDDDVILFHDVENPPSNALSLSIDLNKYTSAVATEDVLFDDLRDNGGFSNLVPEEPDPAGPGSSVPVTAMGALYVKYGTFPGRPLPLDVEPYELTAVYYPTDDTINVIFRGHRYHGFRAKVVEIDNPPVAQVRVWPAEGPYDDQHGVVREILLTNPEQCDVWATYPDGTWPTGWKRLSASSEVGDVGAIYLFTEEIKDAGLAVPKLPQSLDESMLDLVTVDPRSGGEGGLKHAGVPAPSLAMRPCEVCRMLEGPRPATAGAPHQQSPLRPHRISAGSGDARPWTTLNVSGVAPTTGLIEVQGRLHEGGRLALVEDAAGLLDVLRQAVACRPPRARRRLDLVGHSVTANRLLRLGRSVLDLDAARVDLAASSVDQVFRQIASEGLLPRLGIQAVRMVGCCTARSDAGRATLRRLSTLLKVPVDAVCDLVTLDEFNLQSFRGEVADLESRCLKFTLPSPRPPHLPGGDASTATPALDFRTIVGKSEFARRAERTVVLRDTFPPSVLENAAAAIEPGPGVELRGFLAEPVVHVVVVPPGWTGAGTYRAVDVFFDYELVAIYPRPERRPTFYRVIDRALLISALSL